MRKLRIVCAVFFLGAIVSLYQRHDDTALLFAALGFALVFIVESNFDWQQRITRSNWKQSLLEPKAQTTLMGKVAQVMSLLCIVGSLFIERH